MPTRCTIGVGASINAGDAVCVTNWDSGNTRPTVKQANKANLLTSKTVYGVAQVVNGGAGWVDVLVAGEVAPESLTSLGAGDSRIIATKINIGDPAHEAELIRVDRPDGSEHVIGTCDELGTLAIEARASPDRSPHHLVNVNAFGARADGRAFHDAIIRAGALSTLESATAAFTADDAGKDIRVVGVGALGATLVTTIAAFIDVFTVTLSSAATLAMPDGTSAVLWSTDNSGPIGNAVAEIPASGGILLFPSAGVYVLADDTSIPANVQIQIDDGAVLAPVDGKTLTIEGRIRCHAHQHVLTGVGDIAIGSTSFAQLDVKNWGARGDGINDDLPAFRSVLRAMAALLPGDTGGELFVPSGVYVLNGTLGDELAPIPINTTLRGAAAGGEFGSGNPGTVLEFRNGYGDGLLAFDGGDTVAANIVVRDLCVKDGHPAPPVGGFWREEMRVPFGEAVLPSVFNGNCYRWTAPLWAVRPNPQQILPVLGDIVLPTTPNGCWYECTRAPVVGLGPTA